MLISYNLGQEECKVREIIGLSFNLLAFCAKQMECPEYLLSETPALIATYLILLRLSSHCYTEVKWKSYSCTLILKFQLIKS